MRGGKEESSSTSHHSAKKTMTHQEELKKVKNCKEDMAGTAAVTAITGKTQYPLLFFDTRRHSK